MTERAALLGGTLDGRPGRDGGWTVDAPCSRGTERRDDASGCWSPTTRRSSAPACG